MGFNALIHAHRPDIIDYSQLDPNNHVGNLQYAFDVAERELGIAPLLDAEDVDVARPDEKSVITYVASYYHTFARMTKEQKGGRRIANVKKNFNHKFLLLSREYAFSNGIELPYRLSAKWWKPTG